MRRHRRRFGRPSEQGALLGQNSAARTLVDHVLSVLFFRTPSAIDADLGDLDVYTCAMVLLVAHLCPTVRAATGDLMPRWKQCLEILRRYQNTSCTAIRCVKLLEMMEAELWASRKGESLICGQESRHQQDPVTILNTENISEHSQRLNINRDTSDTALVSLMNGPSDELPNILAEIQHPMDPMRDYQMGGANEWNSPQSIDMAWLSTFPFDITFDETIEPLW